MFAVMAIIIADNVMSNAHLFHIFFVFVYIEITLHCNRRHQVEIGSTSVKGSMDKFSTYFSFSRMYPNFKTYWYSTTYSRRDQDQDDCNAFKQIWQLYQIPRCPKVHCNYGNRYIATMAKTVDEQNGVFIPTNLKPVVLRSLHLIILTSRE